MIEAEFFNLTDRLAAAWTTGRPRDAAACFTEDAIYLEPPDRQRYVGRAEIYELSGGDDPPPMAMTIHHAAFNVANQAGFVEYTFRGRRQYHGIAFVGVRDGLIQRWREYQYVAEEDWPEFIGESAGPGG
ncbi:nuclear transport factor 2 family protein [Asanoa siamensis]|uniref:SnoaL-like domain-containing protein n=1 Tax=Asanoa siamensis TaxID=926357 RepID=A0ABQ4D2H9_9ACTN|nr:nuclear transport factor 2 family protein [Asanoa siamensis]GIF77749.1 hypothetical protein Asi02nite_72670 [Asanoa siamensis]